MKRRTKTNIFTKTKLQTKLLGQLDKTKRLSIYAFFSKKPFFKVKKLNAAHEQKNSLDEKKLLYTSILLTFVFGSKRRLDK